MADLAQSGIELEVAGYTKYIQELQSIADLHQQVASTANDVITSFFSLNTAAKNVTFALNGIASATSSQFGLPNLLATINQITSALITLETSVTSSFSKISSSSSGTIPVPTLDSSALDHLEKDLQRLSAISQTKFSFVVITDEINEFVYTAGTLKQLDATAIVDTIKSIVKSINSIGKSKGFAGFTDHINEVISAIQKLNSQDTSNLSSLTQFKTVIQSVISATAALAQSKSISNIGPLFTQLANALNTLGSIQLGTLATDLPILATGLTTLGTSLKLLSTGQGATRLPQILGTLGPSIDAITQSVNNLNAGGNLPAIVDSLGKLGTGFANLGSGAKKISPTTFTTITDGIRELNNTFNTALTNGIDVGKFNRTFSVLANVLANFATAIRAFTTGRTIGDLQIRFNDIVNALGSLNNADIGGLADKLNQFNKPLQQFATAFQTLSALKGIDFSNINMLADAIGKSTFAFQAFQLIFNSVIAGVKNVISAIGGLIVSLGQLAVTSVVSGLQALGNAFLTIGKYVIAIPFNLIVAGFNAILAVVNALLAPFNAIISVVQKVGSVLGSLTFGNLFGGGNTKQFESDLGSIDSNGNKVKNTIDDLSATTKGFDSTASHTASSVQSLGSEFENGEGKVLKFHSAVEATKIASEIIGHVFESLKGALESVVGGAFEATAKFENLTRSLTALEGRELVNSGQFANLADAQDEASKKAAELLDWTQQLGIESPFSKDDINQANKLGLTYGFTTEQVKALTKGTVDYVAAVGGSADDIQGIARALGQINTNGKLQAQDANQLAERGVGVWQQLSMETGKSTAELKKLSEQGLIPADVALKAIQDSFDQFDGVAKQSTNSLDGIVSTFHDIKEEALVETFKGIFEAFKPFAGAINDLLQSDAVITFLQNLGDTVRDNLLFAVQAVAGPLGVLYGLLQSIPQPVVDVIITLAEVATTVVLVLGAVGALNAALTVLAPILGLFVTTPALVVAAFAGVAVVLYQNQDAVLSFSNVLIQTLQPAFDTLLSYVPLISTGFMQIVNTLVSIGDAVIAAFQNPSGAVTYLFDLISTGINAVLPTVTTFVTYMVTGFNDIVSSAAGFANDLVSVLADGLSSLTDWGSQLIQSYAEGILSALNVVADAIGQLGDLISGLMEPGSPPAYLPSIDDWGKETAEVYLDGFTKADLSSISDFGKTIGDVLKSIDGDLVASIDTNAIADRFASSLSNFNVTGTVDTSFLDDIKALAPGAENDIALVAEQFLNVAIATHQAELATKAYDTKVKELQGTLDGLDAANVFETESQQLAGLQAQIDSRFTSEEQKRKAAEQITRINAQRELRGLDSAKKAAEDNLKTQQEVLDATKQRIALANEFQNKKTTDATGGDGSDPTDKLKKEKLKKAKGQALSLADLANKTAAGINKLNGIKIDTGPLDNFKNAFSNAQKNITTTVDNIKSKFTNMGQTLRDLGIDFDTVKRAAIGLATVLSTTFIVKALTPLLPALLAIVGPLAAITASVLGLGIAFGYIDVNTVIELFKSLQTSITGFVNSLKTTDVTKLVTSIFTSIKDAASGFLTNNPFGQLINELLANVKLGDLSKVKDSLLKIFDFSKVNLSLPNIGQFIANLFSNIKLPDVTKIFSNIFDFSKFKINLPNIGALFINLFSNIKLPDVTKIFTDLFAKVSNIKLPSFDLSGLFGNIKIPTGVFKIITDTITNIQQQLSQGKLGEAVVNFANAFGFAAVEVGKLAAAFGVFVSFLAASVVANFPNLLADVLNVLTPILNTIGSVIQAFETFFVNGNLGLSGFIKLFQDLGSAIFGNLFQGFAALQSLFSDLNGILDTVIIYLGDVFGFDGKTFIANNRGIITFFESIITGGVLAKVFSFIKGLGLIKNVFTTFKVLLSPVLVPLQGLWTLLTGIVTVVLRTSRALGFLDKGFGQLLVNGDKFGTLSKIFTTLFGIITRGNKSFGAFAKSTGLIATIFGSLSSGSLVTTLTGLFTGLPGIISKILSTLNFNGIFSSLFSSISGSSLIAPIITAIQSGLTTIGTFLTTWGTTIVTFLLNPWVIAAAAIGGLIYAYVNNIFGFQDLVNNALSYLATNIPVWLNAGWEFATTQLPAILGNIVKVIATEIAKWGIIILGATVGLAALAIKWLIDMAPLALVELGKFASFISNWFTQTFIPFLLQQTTPAGQTFANGLFGDGTTSIVLGSLAGLIKLIGDGITNAVASFFGFGKLIIDSILDGITGALNDPLVQTILSPLLAVFGTNIDSLKTKIGDIKLGFDKLVTDLQGLVFVNPFSSLVSFISGEGGFLSLLGSIKTAFDDVVTFVTSSTIPNIFRDIGNFLSGDAGFVVTLQNIKGEFSALFDFVSTHELPNIFKAISDAVVGDNGILTILSNISTAFNKLVTDVTGIVLPNPFEALKTFLTGDDPLGNAIVAIGTVFSDLQSTMSGIALPNPFEGLTVALVGNQAIGTKITAIGDVLSDLVKVMEGITLPDIFADLYNVLTGPTSLQTKIDAVLASIAGLEKTFASFTLGGIDVLLSGLKTIIDTASQGFKDFGTFLDSYSVPNPFEEIGNFLDSASEGTTLLQTAVQNLKAFLDGITIADIFFNLEDGMSHVKELIQPLQDAFDGLISYFAGIEIPNPFAGLEIPETVKSALKLAGIDIGEEVATETAKSTEETLSNKDISFTPSPATLTSAKDGGTTIGTNAGEGAVTGYNDTVAKPGATDTGNQGFFSGLTSWFSIHSPSQKLYDDVGTPLAQGLINGFNETLAAADLSATFAAFISKFDTLRTGILDVLSKIGTDIVNAITDINTSLSSIKITTPTLGGTNDKKQSAGAASLSTEFISAFNAIASAFNVFTATFNTKLISFNASLISVTRSTLSSVTKLFNDFYKDMLKLFNSFLDTLFKTLQKFVSDVIQLLTDFVDSILKLFSDLFDKLKRIFQKGLDDIYDIVGEAFQKIIEAFNQFATDALAIITNFVANVSNAFAGLAQKFKDAATSAIKAFIDELKTLSEKTITTLNNEFQEIKNGILGDGGDDKGSTLTNTFKSIGKAIVQGIQDGIDSEKGNLIKSVNDLIKRVKEAVESGFGIASPSKFGIKTGKNVSNAFGLGLTDTKQIDNALQDIVNSANVLETINTQPVGETLIDDLIVGIRRKYSSLTTVLDALQSRLSLKDTKDKNKETDGTIIGGPSGRIIGNQFNEGIVKGLQESSTNVNAAVNQVLTDVVQTATKTLGIASPSKVTRFDIAHPAMEGLLAGVADHSGNLDNAIKGVADKFANTNIGFGDMLVGTQDLVQPVNLQYANLLTSLPALTQGIQYLGNAPKLNNLAFTLPNSVANVAQNLQNKQSSILTNAINNTRQTTATSSVLSTNNVTHVSHNREYNLYLSVEPKDVPKVRKHFNVMEFLKG